MSTQFLAKTSSEIEVFQGYPSFDQLTRDNAEQVRVSLLSPCGRFMALATTDAVSVYTNEEFTNLLISFPLKDVYDLHFSPSGNFLSTWERPSLSEPEHKNVKIWYLNVEAPSSEPKFAYQAKVQNGWALQFSKLDDYAAKQFGKEVRLVKLDNEDTEFDFNKPFTRLVPEQPMSNYLISPAEHPTICTFSPEKGGKPAILAIYSITEEGTITKKIASKTFFKADSCQLKWNPLGNAVLCLAITDFDSSNKSYYGENTLYLLSFQGVNGALGGKSVRVPLSQEGPIHDFTWSPTSRQFGVIFGYMPATITFFDVRGNIVHTLAEQPKNTMLFSPSGRYILIAGFGNLQGSVEILDRHDKFKCISKFDAANTSVCKWSPGGEFILTATTSPRLRVDNGLKIWHVTGTLCYVKEYKELLKVDWRHPFPYKTGRSHVIKDMHNKDEETIDPKLGKQQLEVHQTALEYNLKHQKKSSSSNGSASKPVGAYRPPHARRAGVSSTVPGMASKPVQRVVPGMAPATNTIPGMASKESKTASKNKKKRENKKKDAATENQSSPTPTPIDNDGPKPNKEASPEEKKIRSLLKKLRAIEALKQRLESGDKLEDTQILKIQSEDKVLKELEFLGWKDENA